MVRTSWWNLWTPVGGTLWVGQEVWFLLEEICHWEWLISVYVLWSTVDSLSNIQVHANSAILFSCRQIFLKEIQSSLQNQVEVTIPRTCSETLCLACFPLLFPRSLISPGRTVLINHLLMNPYFRVGLLGTQDLTSPSKHNSEHI